MNQKTQRFFKDIIEPECAIKFESPATNNNLVKKPVQKPMLLVEKKDQAFN